MFLFSLAATAQDNTPDAISQQYTLQELTIVNLKKGDKIGLENLIFVGGTTTLEKTSEPVLVQLLQVMQDNPSLKIEIQGHVCCYPDRKHKLSKERAKRVYDYLKGNAIDTKRISYKDFGGREPIYPIPEETNDQRNANRRVEILVLEIE